MEGRVRAIPLSNYRQNDRAGRAGQEETDRKRQITKPGTRSGLSSS